MPSRNGGSSRRRMRRRVWSSSSLTRAQPRNSGRPGQFARGRRSLSGGTAMTLRNRLYMSFGAVLVMVLVMFAVNWRAVTREHEAKKAAQTSLDLKDATDAVKFQMMQNRLYLSNYLLSGDTREIERMNDGLHLLGEKLQKAGTLATSEQQKTAFERVQQQ